MRITTSLPNLTLPFCMVLFVRRFLALVATVGLIGSVCVYAASFAGLTVGSVTNAHPWLFIFFGGVFLLYLPVVVIEYDGPLSGREFFWKGFAKTRPPWAVPAIKILGGVAIFHFVLFLILTHACSPEIVNGAFVLNDHGTIRRVLDQAEYLSLKGWETRLFASFMISFYTVVTLYWWFPSARRNRNPYDA